MTRAVDAGKTGDKVAAKAGASQVAKAKSKAGEHAAEPVGATKLLAAMTGRASSAKARDGDEPVFAYIRSLPQPQRGIAESVDALAARTLPDLKRSVKWGMAWYGVGDGWCFSCGGFIGHVKLTFGRGTSLQPVPPVTPIGMGKDSRGVDLASVEELDEHQVAAWMQQATAIPGFGGKKR
ncbi:YdhG-like domain-containing protein [Rhodanobacter sp. Root179]